MARRKGTRTLRHQSKARDHRNSPPSQKRPIGVVQRRTKPFDPRFSLEVEDCLIYDLQHLLDLPVAGSVPRWKHLATHLDYGTEAISRWDKAGLRIYALLQDYMRTKTWTNVAIEMARIFCLDAAFKIVDKMPDSRERVVLRDRILFMRIANTMDSYVDFAHASKRRYWLRFAEAYADDREDILSHDCVGQRMAWILDAYYQVSSQDLQASPVGVEASYGMSHRWMDLRNDLQKLFKLQRKHILISSIDRRFFDAKNSENVLTERQRNDIVGHVRPDPVQSSVIGELLCSKIFCDSPEGPSVLEDLVAQLSIASEHGTSALIETLDLPCPITTPLRDTFYCCKKMTLRRLISGLYMIGKHHVIRMLANALGVVDEEKQFDLSYQRISTRTTRKHISMHSPLTKGGKYKTVGPPDGHTEQELFWMFSWPTFRARIFCAATSASKKLIDRARCDFDNFCTLSENYELFDPVTGDMSETMYVCINQFTEYSARIEGRTRQDRIVAKLCQSLIRAWGNENISKNASDIYRLCCPGSVGTIINKFTDLYAMFISLVRTVGWNTVCNALYKCNHSTFALTFAESAMGSKFDSKRFSTIATPSVCWDWNMVIDENQRAKSKLPPRFPTEKRQFSLFTHWGIPSHIE